MINKIKNSYNILAVKEWKIDTIPTEMKYKADIILEERWDYFYLYKSKIKELWDIVDKNRLIKKELFDNLLKWKK